MVMLSLSVPLSSLFRSSSLCATQSRAEAWEGIRPRGIPKAYVWSHFSSTPFLSVFSPVRSGSLGQKARTSGATVLYEFSELLYPDPGHPAGRQGSKQKAAAHIPLLKRQLFSSPQRWFCHYLGHHVEQLRAGHQGNRRKNNRGISSSV